MQESVEPEFVDGWIEQPIPRRQQWLRKVARQASFLHTQQEDTMIKTLHGRIRGRTIELDEDLGVVDGQEVEVQVKIVHPKKRLPGPPPGWKPGQPSRTAGLLADCWTEEDDRILEEIYRDRKRKTTREIPE